MVVAQDRSILFPTRYDGRRMGEPMANQQTIWDVDDIAFEDIPTVQDVLCAADGKLLEKLIIDRFAQLRPDGAALSKREKRVARKRVRKALHDITTLKAKRSKKMCVFPLRVFGADADTGVLSQEMSCALVRRTDLGGSILALETMQPVASRAEWRRLRDERDERVKRKGPELYSFALTPWRKLLGYRLWMGGDFTRRERYDALVDFFFEATWHGFSEKEVAKRIKKERADLLEAIAESERDVESGAQSVPFEVLLAQLGLGDYGLETPEDELEAEQARGAVDLACALNHNEYVDLMRRMASLARMVNRH